MAMKQLADPAETQKSLVRLKQELWDKHQRGELSLQGQAIAMKINSCLYSRYPTTGEDHES